MKHKRMVWNLSIVVLFCVILLAPICAQLLNIRANAWLNGVERPGEMPSISSQDWISGDYQSDFENWFSKAHGYYSDMVRLKNTFAYILFAQGNGDVIVGKNHNLFEKKYIDEYLGLTNEWNTDQNTMDGLVDELKQAEDYLSAQGKAVVFLISPSKAEFMPDDIPGRFYRQASLYPESERAYYKLLDALDRYGVCYVDAAQLLHGEHDFLIFPKGGVHWTKRSAVEVNAALNDKLVEQSGMPIPGISVASIQTVSYPYDPEDVDLYTLLNVYSFGDDTNFEKVALRPENDGRKDLRVFLQGGSFTIKLVRMYQETGIYQNIQFLFYDSIYYNFTAGTTTYLPGYKDLDEATSAEIYKNIMASDVVILEVNQQYAAYSGAGFYRFLLDCAERYGK